jgi:indolepyruvate ferredoxin oxidoreductase beta subunit
MRAPNQPRILKVAILAMGGEGGGVLADWIVDLAEHQGWLAQTTSVPGVAQRTGATIYYVEMYPQAQARADGAEPVFALMPLPGDVDVVLASELMECGRAVQRGFVTPDRTTLIASTHRVFSITEKTAMGDGRVDADALLAHAEAAAGRFVRFDMAQAAEDAGSVISAVLFGALAGTRALPFERTAFEQTIARGGVGVQPSLEAFGQAYAIAAEGRAGVSAPAPSSVPAPQAAALEGTTDAPRTTPRNAGAPSSAPQPPPGAAPDPRMRALLDRIDGTLPPSARGIAREGVRRLIDWQDPAYAQRYLDRLAPIAGAAGGDDTLAAETARHLALWMAYEDTIRVAQLKTRATRFARVRGEVRASRTQVLAIDEYLHPRVQELAETLPALIGRRLERPGWVRSLAERFTRKGRVVTTSSLRGYLLLSAVAGLRRWRPTTTRWVREQAAIDAWLARIADAAARDTALATELARCQRLVKGYGDTHERGVRHFEAVMRAFDERAGRIDATAVRQLRDAALADEHGRALEAALARLAPAERASRTDARTQTALAARP